MTQRHQVSKRYWKNGASRFAPGRVATDFQFVKKQTNKKYKTKKRKPLSVKHKESTGMPLSNFVGSQR